jgi:hypothetical protein
MVDINAVVVHLCNPRTGRWGFISNKLRDGVCKASCDRDGAGRLEQAGMHLQTGPIDIKKPHPQFAFPWPTLPRSSPAPSIWHLCEK